MARRNGNARGPISPRPTKSERERLRKIRRRRAAAKVLRAIEREEATRAQA